MPARLRSFVWPVVIALLAATVYLARVSREMADFAVYRTAAGRALEAEPLYRTEDGHFAFKYLPAFALAMAPFAVAPEGAARAIWYGLSVVCLVGLVGWSVAGLPGRLLTRGALAWIAVIFMAKFYAHELTLGQANILLGAMLVAALLAQQRGRPVVAGLLVGLAVFVKPYALVMLPWLAASSSAAAVLAAAAVLTVGLVVPAAIYGWAGNVDLLAGWWRAVRDSTSPNVVGNDNVSFAAMWAKWLGEGTVASGLAVATAALAVGLAVLVWRRRREVAAPDYLEWAFLMTLMPLLSPQGWDYVLLLATPAVVCMADRWRTESSGWRLFFAGTLVVLGLTIFDLMGRALYARFMELSLVTVAAGCVLLSLAHLRARRVA